jgi:hypothetical protein
VSYEPINPCWKTSSGFIIKAMPPHHNRHRPFAGLSSDNTCMVWSWSWEWIGELLREAKHSVLLVVVERREGG